MATTKVGTLKQGLANFFGAIGYIFLVLEWLLVILAYFSWIQTLPFFPEHGSNPLPVAPPHVVAAQGDGLTLPIILGAIITVVMIIIAIYAIFKLPSMVIKSTRRVVHKTAEWSAPAALHVQHQVDTKKNRKRITGKLVVILKLVFTVIAVGLIYFSQYLPKQELEFSIMLTSGLWLVGISLVFFALQYLVAKLLRVDKELLW